MIKDTLTERIIASCYKVHSELGPGFKERVYHNALKLAFSEGGVNFETEKQYGINYQTKKVGKLIVDLIVEIKAVTGRMPDVFKYRVLSYLKVSDLKVGLLINFGNKSCHVKRYVNKYED